MKRILAVLLVSSMLYGCGATETVSTAGVSSAPEAQEEEMSSAEGNTSQSAGKPARSDEKVQGEARKGGGVQHNTGVVTAVEGNTITMQMMRTGKGGGPQENGRNADGEAKPSNAEKPQGDAPEKRKSPEGQTPEGQTPEEQPPEGQPQGETLTVTISDDCQILLQQANANSIEGAVTDIQVGAVLALEYAQDQTTVTTVTVLTANEPISPPEETPAPESSAQ